MAGEQGVILRSTSTKQQMGLNESLETFSIHLAQTQSEIEEVQRLRYRVFVEELGVTLHGTKDGLDCDQFDAYSQHLYIRASETGQVVGTYRIITPEAAQKIGWYTQQEFDISSILQPHILPELMEVGRACVHPDYRNGSVVLLLWKATVHFARTHGYRFLMGCTSVPIGPQYPRIHDVQALLHSLKAYNDDFPITPIIPFTDEYQPAINDDVKVGLPALFKGYLRLGGKVCGEPAYDVDFRCADFFTYVDLDQMSARYLRHLELTK